MQYLARREHSCRELQHKLLRKGCDEALAAVVVSNLESEHLVSDDRFMESLIRARRNRGYGPLRIQKELQEKGVAPAAIENWLVVTRQEWLEDIRRVQRKKFGGKIPKSYAERARQARFLQYRGFTYDQIQQLLNPRGQD
ncbi:regulatory protein RecX [Sulfuricaulis sp.]|uniref:regulatory protein RecX n=1 Tax=Sulfuricaulis sp. TaxID=2003553 RepID=UPI0025FD87A3|nr:regulatory protein RecX [Sulfuricaulis sp.]